MGRRLVEQEAAVQQLNTSNEHLQAKVDELLGVHLISVSRVTVCIASNDAGRAW